MDLCTVLEVSADYILFGTASGKSNNPIIQSLEKLTSHQRMYAEKLLQVYINSCGIE